jgi:hypothetical protein
MGGSCCRNVLAATPQFFLILPCWFQWLHRGASHAALHRVRWTTSTGLPVVPRFHWFCPLQVYILKNTVSANYEKKMLIVHA